MTHLLPSRTLTLLLSVGLVALALPGCDPAASDGDSGGTGDSGDTDGEEVESVTITHAFGPQVLEPAPGSGSETTPCVSWTLDNEEPVYVQAVTLSNLGYYHHSNWTVVPDTEFDGPDGYWKCSDRNYTELDAASKGTVLFAQSTQSWVEEQRMGLGHVIKLPPHSRIIGGVHLLNVAPREVETSLYMSLELIHPRHVNSVLTPFRMSYTELNIPAQTEARFTGDCMGMREAYENRTGHEFDVKLHYALPHYHYLGNHFSLRVEGGPQDGEELYSIDGFNGEANGRVYDPPIDLSGADGLSFTCGYDNWRDESVGWGIGDQEMCVMLGLAESDAIMENNVNGGTMAVGENGGIVEFEGDCGTFAIAKAAGYDLPTPEEIDGEHYVPPTDPSDDGVLPVPECFEPDESVSSPLDPTLSNVRDAVLLPSCSFSSCHGRAGQAAGLNFEAEDLHTELLNHEVFGDPNLPLIEPGNPEESHFYRLLSQCNPVNSEGAELRAMPLNSPILLDDEAIALVREWIEAGAAND